MKNHTLKLIGKVPNFSLAFCCFDALQQGESRVVRSITDSRQSLMLKSVERLHAHVVSLIHYIVAALFRFRPTCLDSFACAFAALFRCEAGGSCWTSLFPAFAP